MIDVRFILKADSGRGDRVIGLDLHYWSDNNPKRSYGFLFFFASVDTRKNIIYDVAVLQD